MKKLTAGIFSVLMGLVAVNAADAAVASKGYVQGQIKGVNESISTVSQDLAGYKTTNDATVAELTQTVADNKAAAEKAVTDLETAVDGKLANKQNTLNVTGGVLTWDAATSTLGLTGIATSDNLETLQTTVNTLNGAETEAGSVKKQIADAIAGEVSRSNGYADQAKSDAIDAANAYTDQLANGAVATNTAAIAAINHAETGILKLAKDYADNAAATIDGNIADLSATVTQNESNISALTGRVSDIEDDNWTETEHNAFVVTNDAAIAAAKQAAIDDATGKINTLTQTVTANAGTAAAAAKAADDKAVAAQGEVDALETVVANNLSTTNTAIDTAKGEAIAAAKTETENQISALDLQAISRVPAECSNANNYCALTTDGKKFVWEVIERDTTEFENGVLKMDGRTAVQGVEEAN